MNRLFENAQLISKRLAKAGFIAYWAGGCVRDCLLDREPKDIDIATTATPADILSLFPESRPVGQHFGVILVSMGGMDFDVATFRREGLYHDGRHPDSVVFCGPEEDAQRRDFTVNGLFLDPFTKKVIDFVNGKEDLEQGLVRCIGEPEKRFSEDHLRMMRAVRFTATLDFEIEENTARSIQRHAGQIERISMERIQEELNRILLESKLAGDAIVLLKDMGLLAETIPEIMAMIGQEQPPRFHPEGDVFTHTVLMLNNMRDRSLELALAVLFHDVGKPQTATTSAEKEGESRIRFNRHAEVGAEMAERILRRLKYSKATIKTVTHCIRNHMRFKDVQKMRKAKVRRLIASPTFPIELELHRLDCEASHRIMDNYHFLKKQTAKQAAEPVLPPRLINGNDIMEIGIEEGPQVGKWLKTAYDYQLEHDPNITRKELLNWIKQQIEIKK